MQTFKKCALVTAAFLVFFILTGRMPGSDLLYVVKVWSAMLLLGLCVFPLTSCLYRSFSDRGWIQSRLIGLTLAGFVSSLLILTHTIPFRGGALLAVTFALAVIVWGAAFCRKRSLLWSAGEGAAPDPVLILTEELLFFTLLAAWCRLYGFDFLGALNSEGPMDYGILSSMMRCDTLPPPDMWDCERLFDSYYWGCHYFTAFLTKLTGSRINEMFTIAKAMVPAASASVVFSTVWHFMKDRKKDAGDDLAYAVGFFSALLFMCSSNLHYLLYGLFRLLPFENYTYWSLTRYVGASGDGPGTITEIPAFSFLLGDHHAHIVNIMYVCCFLSLLYAWMCARDRRERDIASLRNRQDRMPSSARDGGKRAAVSGQDTQAVREAEPASAADRRTVFCVLCREVFADPFFYILGLFITVFFMNNTWDAPIYVFVYVTAVSLTELRSRRRHRLLRWSLRCALTAILLFAASAPFRTTFSTISAGGIIPAQVRTMPGKLFIFWAMHLSVIAAFFLYTIRRYRKAITGTKAAGFVRSLPVPDLFVLMAGFCAVCLIAFPEFLWVMDFYGGRMNTVFKTWLQAAVLLDLVCGYAVLCLFTDTKKLPPRIFSAAAAALFLLSCGYFSFGIANRYGDITDRDRYAGLDAEHVLDTEMPEDAGAIRWLEENTEGQPHILEAWGREITTCGRVSSLTGLPAVLGMYNHEWQFTMDRQDVERRARDVDAMYTSDDEDLVRHLLRQYEIRYVFIGREEQQKYEMNHALLQKLGKVVYLDEGSGTCILEI